MKKYIRTPHTIFEVIEETDIIYRVKAKKDSNKTYSKSKCNTVVIKAADSLDKLCDELIYVSGKDKKVIHLENFNKRDLKFFDAIYGAIWVQIPGGAFKLESVTQVTSEGGMELL